MAQFYDSFDRPNGAPGGNWQTDANTITINGNCLSGSSFWSCHDTTVGDPGRQEAWANFYYIDTASAYNTVRCKVDTAQTYGYGATFRYSAPNWYFRLTKGTTSNPTMLAEVQLAGAPSTVHKLHVRWENGVATAIYNESITLTADDAQFAAGLYGGLAGYISSTRCADFWSVGGQQATLTVNPNIIGNYGGACTSVVFTGTGTTWAVGSAPITASVGTFSAQTATDGTHITAAYCPGTYLGSVTFTDTTTGATCTAIVTSDVTVVPPIPGEMNDTWHPYKTLVDHTGQFNTPNTLLTDQTAFIPAAHPFPATDVNLLQGLQEMYAVVVLQQAIAPGVKPLDTELMNWLTGGYLRQPAVDVAPSNTTLKQDLAAILSHFYNDLEEYYVGTPELLDAITSVTATVDLAPVLDALGLAGYPLYTSIAQMIRATRGDDASSILGVLSELGYIRSTHGYTLESIMDAVAGVTATVDLSPVLTAISNLRGGTTTVQAIRDLLAAVDDKIDAIRSDVTAIRTASSLTLQSVLDAIAAIEIPPASTYDGPPIWPGQSRVTFGTGAALADQLVLNGPMDGVVVNVTTPPRGLGQYMVGGIRLDYGQMRIAFETDRGDLEGWQYFGFEKAIYTPHTMERASKARLQLLGALGGTITPWTRS